MDAPLYVTTFVLVINKDKYNEMSERQKKAIDDNCNTEAAGRVGEFWGKFEDCRYRQGESGSGSGSLQLDAGTDRVVEESLRAIDQDLG